MLGTTRVLNLSARMLLGNVLLGNLPVKPRREVARLRRGDKPILFPESLNHVRSQRVACACVPLASLGRFQLSNRLGAG